MIDPKELRIGNYILTPDGIQQVTALYQWEGGYRILIKKRFIQKYPLAVIDVDPLPLTPEILEDCGFKQMKDKFGEPYLGLTIYNGIDVANLRFYDGETKSVGLFARDIMIGTNQYYLHQVQNLKHALTGTELQVNLKEKV